MKQTKEILKILENRYEGIDEYYLIIEEIEENVNTNPDISIESCKSFMEGISKFTLNQLDRGYDSDSIDKLDFFPLFKKSLEKISDYNTLMEDGFVLRACSTIHLLGEIRNKRGDISHGRLYPKEEKSDTPFSNLVMQMTDGLAFYILSCFSKIEILKEPLYEDNPDFNNWLDEENNFGNLSYSKALFDQDIVEYEQSLLEYNDSKEENKEE